MRHQWQIFPTPTPSLPDPPPDPMRCVRYALSGASILGVVGAAIGIRLWCVAKTPRHKKTRVAFDIDETLIYSRRTPFDVLQQQPIPDSEPDCHSRGHEYWRRPYAHWTLRILSRFNQLYLFTAANKKYAEEVQQVVFPDVNFVKVFSKESCYEGTDPRGRKDLALVADDGLCRPSRELITAGEPPRTPPETWNCLLIDDRPHNRVDKQPFLGVMPYHPKSPKFYRDKEMLRVFWKVMWLNILGLEPGELR